MKVNIATQTLSSSVEDTIQFLMEFGDRRFKNALATIQLFRIIDKLFDLLNSKNIFANGSKTPLKMSNTKVWMAAIEEGKSYLKQLADINGTPLLKHSRKTFVLGFISALTSIKHRCDIFAN